MVIKAQNLSAEDPAEKTIIHGVFLEVHGLGVLITGESGIGKSELALELITRNHCLISDDAPEFSLAESETVHGACPDALRDFVEVYGLGLLNIRAMYGDAAIKSRQDLHLVIHLKKMKSEDMQQVNRIVGSFGLKNVLGVDIPVVTLPIGAGRNLAVLVEAAAKHHILLRKGYNAPELFINRQQNFIHQQSTYRQNPDKK